MGVLLDLSDERGREKTLWRPNSQTTPPGLGYRSQIERKEPKLALLGGPELLPPLAKVVWSLPWCGTGRNGGTNYPVSLDQTLCPNFSWPLNLFVRGGIKVISGRQTEVDVNAHKFKNKTTWLGWELNSYRAINSENFEELSFQVNQSDLI